MAGMSPMEGNRAKNMPSQGEFNGRGRSDGDRVRMRMRGFPSMDGIRKRRRMARRRMERRGKSDSGVFVVRCTMVGWMVYKWMGMVLYKGVDIVAQIA